jgi:CPA2 family monovalent cation:H+ antiporter-2
MQIALMNDILIIVGLSAAVLYICHRLKVPVIVGYLATGVAAGPYGLALIREIEAVRVLAEVGVVSLLFTIGLEFSFRNLMRVRRSVLLGGSLQVGLTILAAAGLSFGFDLSAGQSLFIGFLASLSSTAIVVKVLQERAEVETPHGGSALGILIFQDIIVVPMMILTPLLAGQSRIGEISAAAFLLRGIAIVLLILIGARWIIPRFLYRITETRSRELFLLGVVLLCLTIAWLTHSAGLSLALGAFLAGLVLSESDYSHQALGSILPFRDVFSGFFFVSIGMLLDIQFLLRQPGLIVLAAAAVLFVKAVIAGSAAVFTGIPLRLAVLVGISLSQVGEFSFILSEAGVRHGLLDGDLYQIFLAVSIFTMAATPFMIAAAPRLAESVQRLPLSARLKRGSLPAPQTRRLKEKNHLIIIGYGVNGRNLARAARAGGIAYAVIEMNPAVVREERAKGEPVYYGDGTQEAVLDHVNIREARSAAIVINDPAATRRITELVRRLNRRIYLLVRTRFLQEIAPLRELGADEVIPEEFETSVEIFSRVLAKYLLPREEIEKFVSDVRADGYEMFRNLSREATSCTNLKLCIPDVEMTSVRIGEGSPLAGRTLGETEMRKIYGVTVLALRRGDETVSNPGVDERFQPGDLLFLVGQPQKISEVDALSRGTEGNPS